MTRPFPRAVILLRHARAEHGLGVTDRDRPLAVSGRRDARAVGVSLASLGLIPDDVLVSSAVRTKQTCERALVGLREAAVGTPGRDEMATPQVSYLDELYGADPYAVLDILSALPRDAGTVLVVGHEPTMAATASLLCEPAVDDSQASLGSGLPAQVAAGLLRLRGGLPVAGYAVIDIEAPWAELGVGSGRLAEVVVPAPAAE